MFIENDGLVIRNAEGTDAELLCEWWNDGAVMAHAGFPNGLNIGVSDIRSSLLGDSDITRRRLILEVNSIAVGEMSYKNLGDYVAEIGIKICNTEMQGLGYGSKFIKMLIDELFSLEFNKIVLDTNLKNVRAQHVYEKLGFTKVGVRVDCWTDQLGEPQSAVDYELAKS